MRLDQAKEIKRLVIYFFYDADGIVDRYVPYMLEDIKRNCSEIFVVCNGKLTPEGRETFKKLTPNVMVRENTGFDVWAYKTALEHYGWDKLAEYDEVVMMNSTIMGPIYPFSEMFEEMDGCDVDFWGITKHHRQDENPFGIEYGYIPEHIQSHFIAIRNTMLISPEFKVYWEGCPEIESYSDAIGKHEAIFTKHFADKGFRWEVYCDSVDMANFTPYPLLMMPVVMLDQLHCPIFKRRSFFGDYRYLMSYSAGEQGKELYIYLQEHTNYDIDMIWENILRTCNMADIKNCMALSYIFAEKNEGVPRCSGKVALVIHEYFEDLIDYCYQYALSVPEDSDIYITTNTDKKAAAIQEVFKKGPWNNVIVLVIENRGRDVSSLLVGVADKLNAYDYVCFVHDKKVTQLDDGIKGYAFSERCFKNLLASKGLVQSILHQFDSEPRLGMLCPPPPNFSDYYPTLACEWGPNFERTQEIYNKLELTSPISVNKEPVAPLGTMFWFRPLAMKKLLEYGWKYEDFPKEPNDIDGTVLHGVERIYPFVVQDAGFYTAWVTSDDYMRTEWTNLNFMLRELNVQVFSKYGLNTHFGTIYSIQTTFGKKGRLPLRIRFKRVIKRIVPKNIWRKMRDSYRAKGGKWWRG